MDITNLVPLFYTILMVLLIQNGKADILCGHDKMQIHTDTGEIIIQNVTTAWIDNCSTIEMSRIKIPVYFINVQDSSIALSDLMMMLEQQLQPGKITHDLMDIVITNGGITDVPVNVFKYFEDTLETIKLSDNSIERLSEKTFCDLDKLKTITLPSNNITHLMKHSFCNLVSIQTIDLSDNKLKEIPSFALYNLTNLNRLCLSGNMIHLIQDDGLLHMAPDIHIIFLSRNNLTSIPYKAVNRTRHLQLSYNAITEITDEITTLQTLQSLYIDHNCLTNISTEITTLPELKKLTLNSNNLITIPQEFEGLVEENSTNILDNPWACTCELAWLIRQVHSGYHSDQLWCSDQDSHQSYRNISMRNVSIDNMNCSIQVAESKSTVVLIIGALCLMVICLVTIAILCIIKRRRRRIKKTLRNPCKMLENGHYYKQRDNNHITGDGLLDSPKTIGNGHVKGEYLKADVVADTPCGVRNKVRLGKLLGRGAFGDVYEGITTDIDNTQSQVAVKMIRDNGVQGGTSQLMSEMTTLTNVGDHPNIIRVFGSGKIHGSLILVMELAEQGDLLSYVKDLEKSHRHEINSLDKSEEESYLLTKHCQLFTFLWHVAKGMEYLSRIKIVHSDLAARNILLCKGQVAKISDFGLSRDVYETGYYQQSSKGRLPFKWMSPETLSGGRFNMKSDVWSYGVLLWEIMTLGSSPYPGIPPDMLLVMYKADYIMPKPGLCPKQTYAIMKECWTVQPEHRPDFKHLVDMTDRVIQTGIDKDYLQLNDVETDELLQEDLR